MSFVGSLLLQILFQEDVLVVVAELAKGRVCVCMYICMHACIYRYIYMILYVYNIIVVYSVYVYIYIYICTCVSGVSCITILTATIL